jgi:hypothetical protein
MEGSMADKLLNRLIERAQLWAEVKDDDAVNDGKVIMRKRKAFLDARKEAFQYAYALERTVKEVEEVNEGLNNQVERLHADLADVWANVRSKEQDIARLSKEIEGRNRLGETGQDEIGRLYIQRLGIPELTEVYNRLVLGKQG